MTRIALLQLGFRPFFLGAACYALLSVVAWTGIYAGGWSLSLTTLPATQWHAHEMVFGYSLAVIAGFLLTAVKNWTGIQTINGTALGLLFGCWLIPRVAILFEGGLVLAAVFDMLFLVFLTTFVVEPIARVHQWRQAGIVAKVVMLGSANGLFYVGALGGRIAPGLDADANYLLAQLNDFGLLDADVLEMILQLGLYSGLYLVVSLMLNMGRRIIPLFIENGVGYAVSLRNSAWLDVGSMVVFLLFFITTLFTTHTLAAAWLAFALFLIHGARIAGWHTRGIWRKPLLWSLYLAYGFITLGFLLFALSARGPGSLGYLLGNYVLGGYVPGVYVPVNVAIHSMAFGGVGLMTLSMMCRVSLGHTGRNVHQPPVLVSVALGLLVLGAVVRVGLPLIDMGHYLYWIVLSQVSWVAAFGVFLFGYAPMLVRPRVDGRFG